jgi:hypothetical protein
MKSLVLLAIGLVFGVVVSRRAPRPDEGEGARMAAAARAFLAELGEEQRERAARAFEDANRLDWHYVPRRRAGVALGDLGDTDRVRATRLLEHALSPRGVLKARGVILLEEILGRDPGRYHATVFGEPGSEAWGWRLEGHHLSLNFTATDGETAHTPLFLGAEPALVRSGPHAGLRVLGGEEDAARALLASLSGDARALALRGGTPPDDVILAPGRPGRDGWLEPAGLSAEGMNAAQRALLLRLIESVAGDLRADLAERALERIRSELDGVRFLWVGPTAEGEPFYFRVADERFAIEYDVRAENHVHRVWRDRERDFGRDLLQDHVGRSHGR